MPPLPEHRKPFFTTVVLSLLMHAAVFCCVIFTFTAVNPPTTTFFSFIGSVLSDKDVKYSMSPAPSTLSNKPISSALDLTYGEGTAAQEALKQVKPQAMFPKASFHKTYTKSTFLPTPETPANLKPNTNEQFQLKEPLHIPLKLETHD